MPSPLKKKKHLTCLAKFTIDRMFFVHEPEYWFVLYGSYITSFVLIPTILEKVTTFMIPLTFRLLDLDGIVGGSRLFYFEVESKTKIKFGWFLFGQNRVPSQQVNLSCEVFHNTIM